MEATGGKTERIGVAVEFDIERALLAVYRPRTDPNPFPPVYSKWSAASR